MVKYLKQLKTRERATQRPVLGVRYLKSLKARQKGLFLGILTIVALVVPLFSSAYTTFFVEDFETYNLGALNGQQGWVGDTVFVGGVLPPYEYPVRSGEKSIGGGGVSYKSFTGTSNGIISIWFWLTSNQSSQGIVLKEGTELYRIYLLFTNCLGEDYCVLNDGFDEFIANVDKFKWQNIQLRWLNKKWQYNLNGNGWSAERNFFDADSAQIDGFYTAGISYFDNLGEYVPFLGKVWGVSPVSGTEITSTGTNFTFAWEDLETWDSLSVVFQNRDTGIFSNAKILETVSPSGQETLTFENFNFDRNGKYYFYAVATRYGIEFIEGMYITGKYSYQWSDDLVEPEHWFLLNVEGLELFFEMSDFAEWYGEVSKFTTPTDMFVSIAGFFQPTFNKIGEFGNRIKDYFNLEEVYSQGYEIGKTIAYFNYFVAQISLFLGGFPILKWVFIVILLLVGIFIFRLVLKFIPFLGGS